MTSRLAVLLDGRRVRHLHLVQPGRRRAQPGAVVQLVYVGDDGSETVAGEFVIPPEPAA